MASILNIAFQVIWIAMIVICLIALILNGRKHLWWFVLGAVVALIASFVKLFPWYIGPLIFPGIIIPGLIASPSLMDKGNERLERANVDTIIGRKCIVKETVGFNKFGRVIFEHSDIDWQAIATRECDLFEPGTELIVIGVSGVYLEVAYPKETLVRMKKDELIAKKEAKKAVIAFKKAQKAARELEKKQRIESAKKEQVKKPEKETKKEPEKESETSEAPKKEKKAFDFLKISKKPAPSKEEVVEPSPKKEEVKVTTPSEEPEVIVLASVKKKVEVTKEPEVIVLASVKKKVEVAKEPEVIVLASVKKKENKKEVAKTVKEDKKEKSSKNFLDSINPFFKKIFDSVSSFSNKLTKNLSDKRRIADEKKAVKLEEANRIKAIKETEQAKKKALKTELQFNLKSKKESEVRKKAIDEAINRENPKQEEPQVSEVKASEPVSEIKVPEQLEDVKVQEPVEEVIEDKVEEIPIEEVVEISPEERQRINDEKTYSAAAELAAGDQISTKDDDSSTVSIIVMKKSDEVAEESDDELVVEDIEKIITPFNAYDYKENEEIIEPTRDEVVEENEDVSSVDLDLVEEIVSKEYDDSFVDYVDDASIVNDSNEVITKKEEVKEPQNEEALNNDDSFINYVDDENPTPTEKPEVESVKEFDDSFIDFVERFHESQKVNNPGQEESHTESDDGIVYVDDNYDLHEEEQASVEEIDLGESGDVIDDLSTITIRIKKNVIEENEDQVIDETVVKTPVIMEKVIDKIPSVIPVPKEEVLIEEKEAECDMFEVVDGKYRLCSNINWHCDNKIFNDDEVTEFVLNGSLLSDQEVIRGLIEVIKWANKYNRLDVCVFEESNYFSFVIEK